MKYFAGCGLAFLGSKTLKLALIWIFNLAFKFSSINQKLRKAWPSLKNPKNQKPCLGLHKLDFTQALFLESKSDFAP